MNTFRLDNGFSTCNVKHFKDQIYLFVCGAKGDSGVTQQQGVNVFEAAFEKSPNEISNLSCGEDSSVDPKYFRVTTLQRGFMCYNQLGLNNLDWSV